MLSLKQAVRKPPIQSSSFTVWTTGVSNPVRYPYFRASASVITQKPAFAIDLLDDIYAFHRYTADSSFFHDTQV